MLDGERLAQLRSSHEIELLMLASDVREDQLRESRLNLEGLRLSRRIVAGRYCQYQLLLGKADPVPGTP